MGGAQIYAPSRKLSFLFGRIIFRSLVVCYRWTQFRISPSSIIENNMLRVVVRERELGFLIKNGTDVCITHSTEQRSLIKYKRIGPTCRIPKSSPSRVGSAMMKDLLSWLASHIRDSLLYILTYSASAVCTELGPKPFHNSFDIDVMYTADGI